MLFASLDFFVFLVIVLGLIFVTASNRLKKLILLCASYFFYGYWDVRFLLLIFTSTAVDFLVGGRLVRAGSIRQRKLLLGVSVVTNLGLLGFFKYYNFFIDSARPILAQFGLGVSNLDIILPVGISFYTFQTMSYTLDIYRGQLKPTKSFVDFALFVAFFPQLVAGPIVRARDFLPQLNREIRLEGANLWAGGQIFLVGLAKKLLIADTVAPFVDNVLVRPQVFSSVTVWLAVIAYALQIYADFSGYSDMAIGCARMLGFRLVKNFDMPYLAKNISEFWRRWHISLSSWLRDYLYIALGGNRKGDVRTYVNLMLTMLLGGLWHGASWNFVIWGGLHGLALVVYRLCPAGIKRRFIRFTPLSTGLTFLFVLWAWVIFRVADLGTALTVYGKLLFLNPVGGYWWHTGTFGAILLVVAGHIAGATRRQPELVFFASPYSFRAAFAITLAVFGIYLFAPTDVVPFIYFQF